MSKSLSPADAKKILVEAASKSRKDVQRAVLAFVNRGDPAPRTRLIRYTNAKSILNAHNSKHAGVARPPVELVDLVKKLHAESLNEKPNLFYSVKWIGKILDLPHDTDKSLIHKILQLLATSGRRFEEIYNDKFQFTLGEDGKIHANFLAKKKTKRECSFPIYSSRPGPIWHDGLKPKLWLKLLDDVRKEIKRRNLRKNSLSRSLNRVLKSKISKELTPHKLRGIYANIFYNNSNKKQNRTGFIQDILCLDSQDVAIHYASYEARREPMTIKMT